LLPMAFAQGEQATHLQKEQPHVIIARVRSFETEGVLYDALSSPAFCSAVLRAIGRNRVFTTAHGEALHAFSFAQFAEMRGLEDVELPAVPSKAEQSNSSVLYGNRLILKVFRRIDEGLNPDQEVGRYLTDVARFPHTAPVVGAIKFHRKRKT